MSKTFEHGQDEAQKALEFAEKERDAGFIDSDVKSSPRGLQNEIDLAGAVNGCHSGTRLETMRDGYGNTYELHYNPLIKKLVEFNVWTVPNGEDDIDHEFDVVGVYDTAEMAKKKFIEYLIA